MRERIDAWGRRWPWLGRILAIQRRVTDSDGAVVASAITLSVFVSLFPLVLVGIAVLGQLTANDADLPARLIDSLGLTGAAADTMRDALAHAADSRQMASVVGLVGLAWSGSAVAVALQRGVQAPWFHKPEGLRARAVGMAWLASLAVGFALALALGGVLNALPDAVPPVLGAIVAIAVGLAVEVGVFWWMFWGLGTRTTPPRALLPGAVVAAVGFEVLKLVGTVYVPRLVSRSSALYGSLGVVFAILAWLLLFARLLVYSSAVNAVTHVPDPEPAAEPAPELQHPQEQAEEG